MCNLARLHTQPVPDCTHTMGWLVYSRTRGQIRPDGGRERGRGREREEKVLNGGEGDGTVETELWRQRKETAQPSPAQLSAPLSSVLSS